MGRKGLVLGLGSGLISPSALTLTGPMDSPSAASMGHHSFWVAKAARSRVWMSAAVVVGQSAGQSMGIWVRLSLRPSPRAGRYSWVNRICSWARPSFTCSTTRPTRTRCSSSSGIWPAAKDSAAWAGALPLGAIQSASTQLPPLRYWAQ